MSSRKRSAAPSLPVALTIAGSDSGGGAGIQADLKTFAALGVHGTSAITCLTAQNPGGVTGVQACHPELLRGQIDAVRSGFAPAACKTGMLFSAALIRVVGEVFRQWTKVPLIVDPVMVATSGARLLQPAALRTLMKELLPRAELVTPNVDEAEILTGFAVQSPEDLRSAARCIFDRFGCAVLVKGGHLKGGITAIDLFFDGQDQWLLESPKVKGVSTHGTGCTYSAAITAYRAQGLPLLEAISRAKDFISAAIASSPRAGHYPVLNFFHGGLAGRKARRTARPGK